MLDDAAVGWGPQNTEPAAGRRRLLDGIGCCETKRRECETEKRMRNKEKRNMRSAGPFGHVMW